MQQQGAPIFRELYDLRAVRVLVDNVTDCYAALGVVHALWVPLPSEFDDYIARPKANGYRSLHTAVLGPAGKTLEVQIRTHEMHAPGRTRRGRALALQGRRRSDAEFEAKHRLDAQAAGARGEATDSDAGRRAADASCSRIASTC